MIFLKYKPIYYCNIIVGSERSQQSVFINCRAKLVIWLSIIIDINNHVFTWAMRLIRTCNGTSVKRGLIGTVMNEASISVKVEIN